MAPPSWSANPRHTATSFDTIMTYALFQRLISANQLGRLTTVTITISASSTGHSTSDGFCPEVYDVRSNWVDAVTASSPVPAIAETDCLVPGFVELGTEGMGAASAFAW